jgi:membrane fusion protein, multidrug efflux system
MNQQPHPSSLEKGKPYPAQTPVTKQPGPSGRIWLWLLILAALGSGAYFFFTHPKQNQASNTKTHGAPAGGPRQGRGAGIPPVVAVKAVKGNIGVYITGLGGVTPIYTVSVKSRIDGQLMQVRYTEGEFVHAGDPLVEIDPRPYQVALEQAEGTLLRDQALLDNARIDQARYEKLITTRSVPEQTLATQKALVAQDQGNVKTDQAAIDNAKLNLVYCDITAPITGRLGLRLVDPGNYVQAASATALAVITQVQPISVIFTIAEDQLPAVLEKTHAGKKLRVDAYDREMVKRLSTGYLTTIDNQIDQTTGTLKLRATFDNKDGMLFANQFVNARLLVEEKRNVTLLPSAAIQRNSQTTYVYVVKPDQTTSIRNVTIGTTDGDNSQVTSGLSPGEVVVMTGVDKLIEGGKVKVHMDANQSGSSGK